MVRSTGPGARKLFEIIIQRRRDMQRLIPYRTPGTVARPRQVLFDTVYLLVANELALQQNVRQDRKFQAQRDFQCLCQMHRCVELWSIECVHVYATKHAARTVIFSHVTWWLPWNDKLLLANLPAGCSNTPWPFERAGKDGEIKETERVLDSIRTRFFFVSRVTCDASACEKHVPPVIYGESGRRPPPRRFAPRGRTSPYSPKMTGGTYMSFCTL